MCTAVTAATAAVVLLLLLLLILLLLQSAETFDEKSCAAPIENAMKEHPKEAVELNAIFLNTIAMISNKSPRIQSDVF